MARDVRRGAETVSEPPFAPSPAAAPFAAVGYREFGADLMWLRVVGYAADRDSLGEGVIELLDAVLALDPYFRPAYESGAERALVASHGVTTAAVRRVAKVLEEGYERYPDYWRYPFLAGQVYALDLKPRLTPGSKEAREAAERAVTLLERAVRLPGAPAAAAVLASQMLTELGQAEQAEANLEALILTTDDEDHRRRLIARLARMRADNVDRVREAMLDERAQFVSRWERERPAIPPDMYVALGPPVSVRPLATLAVDRELFAPPPPPEDLPTLDDGVGERVPEPAAAPTSP
ncbi:MAG: hypothetical protein R2939_20505 [Kofleriaceae bacterium]